MKLRHIAAGAAASALAVTLSLAPAQAHQQDHHRPPTGISNVKTVATNLFGPLRIAFGDHGSILVAESMSGQLTSISAHGKKRTLVNAPGREIAGVSYARHTAYYFDNPVGSDQAPPSPKDPALLKSIDHRGKVRTIADLAAFERKHDPDGKTVYGVRKVSKACLAQAPALRSKGEVYSHPYSSAPVRSGVYVGDAGANAILHVDRRGKTRLVKALPAEPIKITEAVRQLASESGIQIPDCMLGLTYWAQPVPTDITVKGNWMYYTVLPGAPGESLATGKVYKMNLHTKKTYTVASGLNAPTGVAVDHRGGVYVSELFGGGVAKVVRGKAVTVLPAAMSADVEVSGHQLIASTDALGTEGKVLRARVR